MIYTSDFVILSMLSKNPNRKAQVNNETGLGTKFVHGARFFPMYHPNNDNTSKVLHIDKLDDCTAARLPIKF